MKTISVAMTICQGYYGDVSGLLWGCVRVAMVMCQGCYGDVSGLLW